MTKSILTVALIATCIISSLTPARGQKGFQIGIEGTPQLSWLQNTTDYNSSSFQYLNTFNCSFGISGQYGFTPIVGLGLNALYSFQGQRFKLDGIERFKSVEYVKVPLMLTLNFKITDYVSFIGKIGPQLGLLTNASFRDANGNNIVSNQKSAYADYELSSVAHAGFGFRVYENLILDATLRFDYGLTNAENKNYTLNINKPTDENGNSSANPNRAITSNMTAGLTIGLRYLLK